MSQTRVATKKLLARVTTVREFCHSCGKDVNQVWTADDALWLAVTGKEGGVLCVCCFDRLAVAQRRFLRWVPIEEPHD